jgi:hypothetical protein
MTDNNDTRSADKQQNSGEISLKELILRIKDMLSFLRRKWVVILSLTVIGAVAGFFWAKSKKPKYMAQSIFVLDEGNKKSPSMGGLAALGFDLGGSSQTGLFSGTKNIMWLYSSSPMLKRALLSTAEHNGKKELLVDWFIEESNLGKQFGNAYKRGMFLNVRDTATLSPEQNSILLSCSGLIASKYLKVKEEEATDNMITVSITSKDELFSKEFTETLVNTVNQFYIQSKTMKTLEEITALQAKTDSVKARMDNSMYQAASAVDAAPNANPNLQVLRVAPQRKGVEVNLVSAIYVELSKNLESRKMTLTQETPLIQVIDSPALPLQVILPDPKMYAIIGAILVGFITIATMLLRYFYSKIMK